MEGRAIEYRHHGGGLEYHNSPLIGEIASQGEYMHRSIDQLRSLNERGAFNVVSSDDFRTDFKLFNNNFTDLRDPERVDYLTSNLQKLSSNVGSAGGHVSAGNSGSHDINSGDSSYKENINCGDGRGVVKKNVAGASSISSSCDGKRGTQKGKNKAIKREEFYDSACNGTTALNPHSPTTMVTDIGGYKKTSKKIFSSKADLQLHTQIHMREAKPYKCSQCSKAFANSSYLSQHTRIHLGIKPYRCEICQRKFTQLSHLQQHIRTHTGDKPYKCRHPGCQKAFSQLSNLQSHSRCHQTDKPYKCNSCYKCFSDEPSLLEHIPKHKESKHLKTHICQYCGKSYTQETYLSKHMQKHAERTDKRPPITGSTLGLGLNRNLGISAPHAGLAGDHPYWPKVSPDSAASLTEVMQHQQPHPHHEFSLPQHQNNSHIDLQSQHHRMLENHRGNEDVGEDLVVSRQNTNNLLPPSSSPNGYDSITKTTTNSAFTPINSMTPHLNSLGHHPMAQRPYLYDAIGFQNKNVNQNTANSFPNQLISLHQIRNYAHQSGGLMAGEHLLGVSVGPGKDKG